MEPNVIQQGGAPDLETTAPSNTNTQCHGYAWHDWGH